MVEGMLPAMTRASRALPPMGNKLDVGQRGGIKVGEDLRDEFFRQCSRWV